MKVNSKTKFDDINVHITHDSQGKIHISLQDLCKLVKRDDIIEQNKAIAVCPEATKMKFRQNGIEQWSIRPMDMKLFLSHIRKESIVSKELLNDIEQWGNKLLELDATTTTPYSERFTIEYDDKYPISFYKMNGTIMVNSTQIAQIYGKIPSEWLRISSTNRLRIEMLKEGLLGEYAYQVVTTRGRNHGATWIELPLIVPMAEWLDPDSKLVAWCKEQIKRLLPQMDIISSIHEIHIRRQLKQRELPCLQKPMPENLTEAIEMIEEMKNIITNAVPKIVFYEDFIENRDWFKSTRIAEELGITPHQLHQFLLEQGICKYENKQWTVFPSYRALQVDVPYMWTNSKGKQYALGGSKRWTQSGREFILELWDKNFAKAE